jgi:hypothetical protein
VCSLAVTQDREHDSPGTVLVRGGIERSCISCGNTLKASASYASCQPSTHTSSPKFTRDDAYLRATTSKSPSTLWRIMTWYESPPLLVPRALKVLAVSGDGQPAPRVTHYVADFPPESRSGWANRGRFISPRPLDHIPYRTRSPSLCRARRALPHISTLSFPLWFCRPRTLPPPEI